MRNAVILLAVVALLFVAAGAFNQSLLFDIDYGFGALLGVSLFWITVVTAGVIFLTGLVAALLARSSAASGQRKLERELQTTYQRLREAEARVSFLSAGVALGGSAASTGSIPLTTPAREYRAPGPASAPRRPAAATPGAAPAESRPIAAPSFSAAAPVVIATPPEETQVTPASEPVTTIAGEEAAPADEAATVVAEHEAEKPSDTELAPTEVLPPAEAETIVAAPDEEPETIVAAPEPEMTEPATAAAGGGPLTGNDEEPETGADEESATSADRTQ